MCGICGFIGKSKDFTTSYELITHLFMRTQIRGEDASGMWGAINNDTVIYHKEPIKSNEFVKTDMWEKVSNLEPDLLLCHTRQASVGVGVPSINKNNHPFLSRDGTAALVHNGRVPDVEYRALKRKYPTISGCDSEILLRIFEAGKDLSQEFKDLDEDVASRMVGLKDIWSFLSLGQMAVAIGETAGNGNRRLWLFRNKHRTLWLADMRHLLGQVFFFSVPSIWKLAIDDCSEEFKSLVNSAKVKLIDLPTEEIWMFNTGPDLSLSKRRSLKRFEILTSGSYEAWKNDEDDGVISIPVSDRVDKAVKIITDLNDADELKIAKKSIGFHTSYNENENNKKHKSYYTTYTPKATRTLPAISPEPKSENMNVEIDVDTIDKLCESIKSIIDNIQVTFSNSVTESSATSDAFCDLKMSLEHAELDLEGTFRILER